MRQIKKALNQGFTLIELIVVITILGILAAVAVPRFVALQSDARKSVMEGVYAAMVSSANFVYAKSLIDEQEYQATGSVTINGTVVDTVYGFPAEDEILGLIDLTAGKFNLTVSDGVISYKGVATPANCQIDYDPPLNPGDAPAITLSASLDCK